MDSIITGQNGTGLFESEFHSPIPTEKLQMQTRTSHTSGKEWVSRYEYNLRRAYKYLMGWKPQSSLFPDASHSPSFRSSKVRNKSRTVAEPYNEKMGITQSRSESGVFQELRAGETPCLPLELHIEILKYLDWKEQARLTRVCKTWRAVITDWIIPMNFRSLDTVLGPHIINPLFALVECELGSAIWQTDTLEDEACKWGSLIDQPLCWPPAYHVIVRVSDERTDGLEPGVDESINVIANNHQALGPAGLRIRDILTSLDTFYRQVNEDRVIADDSDWASWKFRLETNKWWRRGYLKLYGRWEWQNGGKCLCLFAKKVAGAWESNE